MIEELVEIFESYTNEKLPEVTRDTLLAGDFGLNSFELFDIICSIEDKYDIEIPDRVLMSLTTVGDLIDYIEEAKD